MKCCDKLVKPMGGAIFATICVAALAMPLFADPVQIVPGDYAKTFNVSFPGYRGTTTLENFPVLVKLSAELNDFNYSKCADKGGDLRFPMRTATCSRAKSTPGTLTARRSSGSRFRRSTRIP